LRTSDAARLCIAPDQDGYLFGSWNCYRVSDWIVPTDLERRLPLRSSVIADTSTNSAERVKADLKNIMLRRWCFVWYSMYFARVEECLWSYRGGRSAGDELVTRVSAEATVAWSRDNTIQRYH
jgi:hypothetical protein